MLLPDDVAFLRRQAYCWEEKSESGFTCVVIRNFPLPPGYQVAVGDLLVRLPVGFPDAAPDMWWFDPPLRLASTGVPAPNADQPETHLGRTWQRWSRHFPGGAWRPGRSGLESYLSLIRKDLERWVAL